MIESANLVNVIDISNLGLTVGHPNGTLALITKIGDLKINNDNTLYDVLVVPEYTIRFKGKHDCGDLVDNSMVFICLMLIMLVRFLSKTLWHQRLGHPTNQVLDVPKTTLSLDSYSISDHLCDTCNGIRASLNQILMCNKRFKSQKKIDNENPKRPYDEGRVSSNDDDTELSPNNQGNDDSDATTMDETNNTHPGGNVSDGTDFINDLYENSEFNYEIEGLPVNIVRRSSRQTKLPTSLNDFVNEGKVKYGVERVIDAMNVEIEALNKNNNWEITNLPANRNAIGKKGIDFDEIFSPVVKMSNVRCVIALSVTNNLPLFELDVNNAFLYGDLNEEIYMTIPQGFVNKDNKTKVYRLVKSLYGLKQSPRMWNEKLANVLKENDFVQSINDHYLFTKSKNNKFIALLVYVDDIVVTRNCKDEIDKFKTFLKSKFQIKDLGHLKYFLGIKVIETNKDLCLTQRKYCLELLKEYGLIGCKSVSTPMEPNSCLAQYMHSPLKSHLNCPLNVFRYLKTSPDILSRGLKVDMLILAYFKLCVLILKCEVGVSFGRLANSQGLNVFFQGSIYSVKPA
ncbi:ribonuclease H-like domain-containing protein [Tanacetum coccineum]